MTAPRLPLPQAYADLAFIACIRQAAANNELVLQFDRLCGADLSRRRPPIERLIDEAAGKTADDVANFVRFVHDCVYMRVGDDVLTQLRAAALGESAT